MFPNILFLFPLSNRPIHCRGVPPPWPPSFYHWPPSCRLLGAPPASLFGIALSPWPCTAHAPAAFLTALSYHHRHRVPRHRRLGAPPVASSPAVGPPPRRGPIFHVGRPPYTADRRHHHHSRPTMTSSISAFCLLLFDSMTPWTHMALASFSSFSRSGPKMSYYIFAISKLEWNIPGIFPLISFSTIFFSANLSDARSSSYDVRFWWFLFLNSSKFNISLSVLIIYILDFICFSVIYFALFRACRVRHRRSQFGPIGRSNLNLRWSQVSFDHIVPMFSKICFKFQNYYALLLT